MSASRQRGASRARCCSTCARTCAAVRATTVPVASWLSVSTPILGSIGGAGQPGSARGTSQWFVPGNFPNLIRPYTLTWTVVDGS